MQPLSPYRTSHIPQIENLRQLPNSSLYLILGTGFLQILLRYKFSTQKDIHESLKKNFEIARSKVQFFGPPREYFDYFGKVLETLYTGNLYQSLNWILHYVCTDQNSSNSISNCIKAIIQAEIPEIANINSLSSNQSEQVCQTFANILGIKIVLIICESNSLKSYVREQPGRYPILYVVSYQGNYFIAYTKNLEELETKQDLYNIDEILYNRIFIYDHQPSFPYLNPQPPNSFQPFSNFNANPPPFSNFIANSPQPFEPFPNEPKDPPEKKIKESDYPKINEYTEKGKISKRTDISMLNIDSDLKKELKSNYCHCIGISEKYNQLRAFTTALNEALLLNSNSEIKSKIRSEFDKGLTMNKINLEKNIDLNTKNIKKLLEKIIGIYKISLDSLEKFDKNLYKKMKSRDDDPIVADLSPDFLEIQILSKLFGVTSVVIYQNSQQDTEFTKTKFNDLEEGFNLELHFFATKTRNNYFFSVLITNSHQFEDDYDIFSKEKSLKKPLKIKVERAPKITEVQESNNNLDTQTVKYLLNVSKLQDELIKTISDCIQSNKPVIVPRDKFTIKISGLNNIKGEINYQVIKNKYSLPEFCIIELNQLSLNQGCAYCGQEKEPEFVNSCGCWSHYDCIENIFKEWYELPSIEGPLSTQKINCPKCNKLFTLSSFLELDIGKKHKKVCEMEFDKIFECQLCNVKSNLNTKVSHGDCEAYYCLDCVKYESLKGGFKCSCGYSISLDIGMTNKCKSCNIETLLFNFLPIKDTNLGLLCKKCWIDFLNNTKPNLIPDIHPEYILGIFNQDLINCSICANPGFKNYSDYVCQNGCEVCFNHFDRDQCSLCGDPMVFNPRLW